MIIFEFNKQDVLHLLVTVVTELPGSGGHGCFSQGFVIVSDAPGHMAEASSPGSQESPRSGEQSPQSSVREQDRFLPIANISRIMKKALPANGKIAKDAKETVQECVSEFISFITSEYPFLFLSFLFLGLLLIRVSRARKCYVCLHCLVL